MSNLVKILRSSATEAEKKLWSGLRDRRLGGLKFRPQQPIAGGRCIVDFVCLERKLVVEVDGSQHTPVSLYRTSRGRNSWLRKAFAFCAFGTPTC